MTIPLRAVVMTALLIGAAFTSWQCTDQADDSATSDTDALEKLRALPYIGSSSVKSAEVPCGVTVYDPSRSFAGYNLHQDYEQNYYLVNMEGTVIHSWSTPGTARAEHGVLLENGDLVGVATNSFFRIDWDSNVVFNRSGPYHHDVEVLEDGSYLGLSKETHEYNGYQVNFDRVEHISEDGELLSAWSAYDHFSALREHHRKSRLDTPGQTFSPNEYDYYHFNTIKVLPETPLGKKDRRFRKGNWLLCSRHTDLIFVLDQDSGEILWSWGPDELQWPHYPAPLPDGTMLIFDNGNRRGYSRVLRIDPPTGTILWKYERSPKKSFFSNIRGGSQPLPNGNILITESEKAHVFEIDSNSEVVWEYYNPSAVDGKRLSVYRMIRYPEEFVAKILAFREPKPLPGLNDRCEQTRSTSRDINAQLEALRGKRLPLKDAVIEVSELSRGSWEDLFDGDPRTGVVTSGVNPGEVSLSFPGPVEVTAIRLFVGQENDPSDRDVWWVESAESEEDLTEKQDSYRLVVAPQPETGGRWAGIVLDDPVKASFWKVTVKRTSRDNFVHLYEIELTGVGDSK